MIDLRKLARDQLCTVYLPGCDGGGPTTVLAHIRRNIAGMGMKPADLCGVYACARCHNLLDGREQLANITRTELDQYILFALLRTLAIVQKAL